MKQSLVASLTIAVSHPALALADTGRKAGETGVSALWILANFCYAGMRAQGHPGSGWRILSFIFGFPGTAVSWLVIREGEERAYGVDLPRIDRRRRAKPVPPDMPV